MVVIIIAIRKDIHIGEEVITGIILIDPTWDVCITTGTSTVSGIDTITVPESVIGINLIEPFAA